MDARDAVGDEDGRTADGEAHEAMAVHVRMPGVIRMVEEDRRIFKPLPEFGDHCVIHAQEDRFVFEFLRSEIGRASCRERV